jgi:glutamine amidotransferase PdxT
VLAVAFHPELTDDGRLHRWLLDVVGAPRVREAA